MRYTGFVISVKDINASKKFYEELFDLEVYQDYGINITFDCGLSLQQDFDWLINIEKEKIIEKANDHEICFEEENFDAFLKRLSVYPQIEYLDDVIEHSWGQRVVRFYDLDKHIIEVGESMKMVIIRFIDRGMTTEQISKKMDVSVADLKKLLND